MVQSLPLRAFICYSHTDDKYRKELETHLVPLKRQGILRIWSDRQIDAGEEWEQSIRQNLDAADIILLLISPDFLASEFCCNEELKRAMERHEAGEARVIPVFLRPCYWKGEVFGKLQGVPANGKPVSQWDDRDEAFTGIVDAISRAIERLSARVTSAPPAAEPPPAGARPPPGPGLAARPSGKPAESDWPDLHVFRDAPFAPRMVVLPAGAFLMGSPDGDELAYPEEHPQHRVRIGYRLAVGQHPVTFAQWDACLADGGVDHRPDDEGWGRGQRPVINVSWDDAQRYLAWLCRKTRRPYRLLSEAEWEYAARAGTTTRYWWGESITPADANYGDTGVNCTTEVGDFPESPFGLYDMLGNVWEWTQDSWNKSYVGAPGDGSPWTTGKPGLRVVRGGSWCYGARDARAASRSWIPAETRNFNIGFRVARAV